MQSSRKPSASTQRQNLHSQRSDVSALAKFACCHSNVQRAHTHTHIGLCVFLAEIGNCMCTLTNTCSTHRAVHVCAVWQGSAQWSDWCVRSLRARVHCIQQTKSPIYYDCYCSLVYLLNSNEYMGWKLNLESATYPINHRYTPSILRLCLGSFREAVNVAKNRETPVNVNCNGSNANARRPSKIAARPIPNRELVVSYRGYCEGDMNIGNRLQFGPIFLYMRKSRSLSNACSSLSRPCLDLFAFSVKNSVFFAATTTLRPSSIPPRLSFNSAHLHLATQFACNENS